MCQVYFETKVLILNVAKQKFWYWTWLNIKVWEASRVVLGKIHAEVMFPTITWKNVKWRNRKTKDRVWCNSDVQNTNIGIKSY